MRFLFELLAFLTLVGITSVLGIIPNPLKRTVKSQDFYALHMTLQIQHNYPTCFILDDTIKRFVARLNRHYFTNTTTHHVIGTINRLDIVITKGCNESQGALWPTEEMIESYDVEVYSEVVTLQAQEVWGVLRGLETILQMLRVDSVNLAVVIHDEHISDAPEFAYRGFLIDTSRHYLSLGKIYTFLDAMSYVKMNVLHWHLVDDNSFPYLSYSLPELALKGAYHPLFVYTQGDVRSVLEYARLRGIRVVPEFDTPGHTKSWGKGFPDLLTPCYGEGGASDEFGPLNPAKDIVYVTVLKLFSEVASVFPDAYVHLGGDEVNFSCWMTNPEVKAFMEQLHLGEDYSKLLVYYVDKVIKLMQQLTFPKPRRQIVWQEVFEHGYRSDNRTIIHVWQQTDWKGSVQLATAAGFPVILSSCWYLDLISYGQDWILYFSCNPRDFSGTEKQKKLVIGGAAAIWGEYVDDTNLIQYSWPRGAAVAERLWSSNITKVSHFHSRLSQLRCLLIKWGIEAAPVDGPGFCSP